MAFLGHLLSAPDNIRKGHIDEIGTMRVATPLTIYRVWFEIDPDCTLCIECIE